MKAAVFHKPGDALTIETVPQPSISDRENARQGQSLWYLRHRHSCVA